MTTVLTGGTGSVGQALRPQLSSANYKIHLLAREKNKVGSEQVFLWPEPHKSAPPLEAFPKNESYGLILMAGEPVSQWPWTKQIKEKIYSSRIEGTRNLVSQLKKLSSPPQFFLSASAMGIYGERGDEKITESSKVFDQQLFGQKLCKDWEAEALQMSSVCRTLIFRLGIVMSEKKGFLHEQIKWLKRGFYPLVISRTPSWLSWIALEDLNRMILWAIKNQQAEGIYNASSPQPLLLKDFYRVLASQIKSKSWPIPSPLFLMKLAGGEMAKNLLASCKAFPEKALSQGFVFKKDSLEKALKNSN